MSQKTLSKLTAMLALAVLFAVPALAQEPAPGVLGESIDVRVVNLEAVVTDKKGNRIAGLEPQDFRLKVDGEEVPITYFTEIRGGDAVVGSAGEALAEPPALVPGERLGTSYLVFIDEYFSIHVDRKRAVEALVAALPNLAPEDRMAIVAWDGTRLEMLSSWSRSLPQLTRAFETALERPARGLQRLAELRQFEVTRRYFPARGFRGGIPEYRLELEERAYANQLASQVERTVSAGVATLRGFASPPGRKVMLVLSGGWPFDPASYAAGDQLRLVSEPGIPDGRDLYRPLAETANLLGYTLYPVDLPGLQATSRADASRALPAALGTSGRVDDYRENEIHYTLDYLAAETGGQALRNGRRDDALERVIDDTRSFYWLGFTPDRVGDDRSREIELEVLVPGLKVRSRESFADLSRQSEVAMAVESMLLFGSPATGSPLEVAFGQEVKAGWGKREVPVTVTLPVGSVTLLPAGDRYVARLELRVAALDDAGGRSEIPSIPIVIETTEVPEEGGTLSYETTLRLSRKAQDVVLALYDQASGETYATRAHLDA